MTHYPAWWSEDTAKDVSGPETRVCYSDSSTTKTDENGASLDPEPVLVQGQVTRFGSGSSDWCSYLIVILQQHNISNFYTTIMKN